MVKEDDLYEFFKECGDIEAVRVVRDARTGVGKGFGFISFKSKDGVILALEKHEQEFNGRVLRVVRAKNETQESNNKQKNSKKQSKDIKPEKSKKNIKNSDSKPEFEGLSAKKIKVKTNKKKTIQSNKSKKKQKNLAEILSH
jgi:nucleolar protein 12